MARKTVGELWFGKLWFFGGVNVNMLELDSGMQLLHYLDFN